MVADISRTYEQVVELRRELEDLDDGSLQRLTEREYEESMDRLGGLVDELHRTGSELRDFELGRVEFPADFHGRRVMLSWQIGDPQVQHWRPLRNDDDEVYSIATLQENEAA